MRRKFFAASEASPIVPLSKHSLIKFACLLIALNLTSKKPFLAIPQEQWVAHFEAMFAWDKVARERVSACKLPILYIEDSGGCYSDLPLFSSLCPQLVIGK